MSSVARARVGIVVLLLVAAFFAAAPWLGCAVLLPVGHVDAFTLRICTLGDVALRSGGYGVPGFTGPYWGNLGVGIFYLVAAILVARRTRPLSAENAGPTLIRS
jgi:hypothetical protein